MKGLSNKKGISLIVLVITIIVIIILATAVILTLSQNNPIENAKKAVNDNNVATKKEAATIAYAEWYLEENISGSAGKSAQEYVEEALGAQGIDPTGIIVSNDGSIVVNPPVIPKGFEYVTGTVENGFVIVNSTDNNEFVWVPVEKGTFERSGFGANISSLSEPSSEDKSEHDAMVASVTKYGGFYIARYEASRNSTTNKAQSIKNQQPWSSIKWGTSSVNSSVGAVEAARAVYPASNATNEKDPVSTLIYGVQWDATVKFILKNYPGITTDSTGYGNYRNDLADDGINTGSNDKYKLNNIYDMAGNYEECTMEYNSSNVHISRGGEFASDGNSHTISYRSEYDHDLGVGDGLILSFRLALYVK